MYLFLGKHPLKESFCIKLEELRNYPIRIMYKKGVETPVNNVIQGSPRDHKKSKERTIGEAYESLVKWEQIYHSKKLGSGRHTW